MSVKILKNTDTHKENRILYETGMEKLGFFDLETKDEIIGAKNHPQDQDIYQRIILLQKYNLKNALSSLWVSYPTYSIREGILKKHKGE